MVTVERPFFKSAVRKSYILTLEKQNKNLTLQKICTCLFANTPTKGRILRQSLPILNKSKISLFVILHLEGIVEQPAHDAVSLYTGNYVIRT